MAFPEGAKAERALADRGETLHPPLVPPQLAVLGTTTEASSRLTSRDVRAPTHKINQALVR